MKTKDIYLCQSCDCDTEDGSPLILKNEEEYEHHQSLRHNVKIKQAQIKPEQTSEKLAKFATGKMLKVIVKRSDPTRVFGIVKTNNHFETIELDKKNLRSTGWLQVAYYDESKQMVSDEQCSNVIGFLKTKSLMSEKINREEVHLRIAYIDDEIYYDLGRTDWKLIKITKNGIHFVDYGINNPIFTRTNRTGIQTEPNLRPTYDALDEFVKLIRVPNFEMFKVHFISMFIAGLPMPCITLQGHSGSAKSSTSSMIKRVIDPIGKANKDNLKSFPHGEDNFVISLASSYFSAFENISHIDKERSDMLCRAITGGSFEKRAHYTNDEIFSISIQRKILINGISFDINEADLIDRVITYNLERISKKQRLSEKTIDNKFRELLPDLLGQIFLILQKVLGIIKTVEETIPHKQRMADFSVFGEAIYQSMGNDQGKFLKLYESELSKNLQNLHDANPIVKCLEHILETENKKEIQAESLYRKIKSFSESEGYSEYKLPKSASGLKGWIDRAKPLLDESQIVVTSHINSQSKEKSGFNPNTTIYEIVKMVSEQIKLKEYEE